MNCAQTVTAKPCNFITGFITWGEKKRRVSREHQLGKASAPRVMRNPDFIGRRKDTNRDKRLDITILEENSQAGVQRDPDFRGLTDEHLWCIISAFCAGDFWIFVFFFFWWLGATLGISAPEAPPGPFHPKHLADSVPQRLTAGTGAVVEARTETFCLPLLLSWSNPCKLPATTPQCQVGCLQSSDFSLKQHKGNTNRDRPLAGAQQVSTNQASTRSSGEKLPAAEPGHGAPEAAASSIQGHDIHRFQGCG